jgi:oligopeptide/dipeptide ABC transporter ATP-binding protein
LGFPAANGAEFVNPFAAGKRVNTTTRTNWGRLARLAVDDAFGIQGRQGLAPDARAKMNDSGRFAEADRGDHLLEIKDLTVDFVSVDGRVRILNGVSLNASKGEVVGIVGESGSGKTTLGLAILGLLDSPPAQIVRGSVVFEGNDLLKLRPKEMEAIHGTGINMVFQEPLDALNPVYTVESQIGEALKVQRKRENSAVSQETEEDRRRVITELLRNLCIDKPEEVLERYPHELSGGMRQRVAISISTIEKPRLVISDEPTTGLDAYVQGRILGMFSSRKKSGGTLLYITHDLTIASQICDRIYIMYAGRVMEAGETRSVLENPFHPYTNTLVASVPQGFEDAPPLAVQLGEPPDLRNLPGGCKFNPRCPYVMEICKKEEPKLEEILPGRHAACWRVDKTNGKFS